MKIDKGNQVYLQKGDIDFVFGNDMEIPCETYIEHQKNNKDRFDFIKVDNFASQVLCVPEILDYTDYASLDMEELESIERKLARNVTSKYVAYENYIASGSNKDNSYIRESKNYEHILTQIQMLIRYKKGLDYPKLPAMPKSKIMNDSYFIVKDSSLPHQIIINKRDGSSMQNLNRDELEYIKFLLSSLLCNNDPNYASDLSEDNESLIIFIKENIYNNNHKLVRKNF